MSKVFLYNISFSIFAFNFSHLVLRWTQNLLHFFKYFYSHHCFNNKKCFLYSLTNKLFSSIYFLFSRFRPFRMIRNFWVGDFQLKLMLCCYFLETDGSYLCLLSRSKLNNMKNLTQSLMKYSFDHCTEFFLLRFSIGRWHSETVQLSNKLKLLCVMFSFKI